MLRFLPTSRQPHPGSCEVLPRPHFGHRVCPTPGEPLRPVQFLGTQFHHSTKTARIVRQQAIGFRLRASKSGGAHEGAPADENSVRDVPLDQQHPHANLQAIATWLFLSGFFLGPPLDGLHSVTGLQVYDGPAAIVIGPPLMGLYTSLWVFPLLGVMYVVVGLLQLQLDRTAASVNAPKGSPLQMLACLGVLIGLLRFSSLLYEASLPPAAIAAILFACANSNWYAFDRTLPGYLLALLLAVGAPLSEIIFIKLGLWHYSTPDIFIGGEGLVSWTSCCYFFYTQWVATVARTLDAVLAPSCTSPEDSGPRN